MSHAHRIEVEGESGPQAGPDGADETAALSLAAAQLWMLPLLLLQVICELFSRHLAELKAMRRTRPLPTAWRTHLSALREAEWPIAVLKAEGARQRLAGRPLRLAGIACPEPPADFQPALPQNALSFHRRLEAIARFNADPEAHVRRHAERIRRRIESAEYSRHPIASNPTNSAATIVSTPNPATNCLRRPVEFLFPLAIRGPPSGLRFPAPSPSRPPTPGRA